MQIIKKILRFEGSEGHKALYVSFDKRANLSLIHPDNLLGLGLATKLKSTRTLLSVDGEVIHEITHRTVLDFYINDILLSDEFLIFPGLSADAIIGAATMQKWHIKLDFDIDKVIVDPKVAKMQLI